MTPTKVSTATDVPGFVDRIVRPLTHLLNPFIVRIAGGWFPMFSLLHHRGHKSGRVYATPVTAFPRGGYFWLGLAFGENSGWARNVLAAGNAELRYRGTDYHLVEATVVNVADIEPKLVPPMVRIGSAVAGVHKVLRCAMSPLPAGRGVRRERPPPGPPPQGGVPLKKTVRERGVKHMDLKGKTALVTGASRGIGSHIASALAGRGMNLVLTGRSGAELEAVAAENRKLGVRVVTVVTDLLDADARTLLVGAAEREFGGVDVLVNNAGGDPLRHFDEMSIEENLAILNLNLTAPIALTHLVLPEMLKRGHGHIINISAMAGRVSFPFTEAYAAAKDGVIGFTRVLRSDYRSRGVTAAVLILGAIAGAGQGQRTLDDMKQKTSSFMAPVGMVTKALLRALDRDKVELVVMPGPGRLMRALMDFFPGMGPWINQQLGVNKTLREVQAFRQKVHSPR